MSTKKTTSTNKTRQRKAERRKAKQKQRQKQARANYTCERFGKGVCQTWIDERAGSTYDERLKHWHDTYDERHSDPTMHNGYGFRGMNPITGRTHDLTFNTIGEAIAGSYQYYCETVPTSDDGTRQMSFPSLGSRIYDLNNPDDTEFIKLGIVLIYMYRYDMTARPIAEMILYAFEKEWTREMKDEWWDLIYENLGYRPEA